MSKKLCNIHGLYETDKCQKCKQSSNRVYNKVFRDQEVQKFYNSTQWKKIRNIKLSQSPLCVVCGAIATHVDHIKEIKDGGSPTDLENLQTMCLPCHNRKTQQQKKARGGGVKSLHNTPNTSEPPTQKKQTPRRGG